MSDPHRTFGDTSNEHDLRLEPTTDAPNDADALDALLNEIASGNGTLGTRQREPNARTDDAASVMATAAAFHRQVETAHGRDAQAARPDPQLWETIMARTSTTVTAPMPSARIRPTASRGHTHNADLKHRRRAARQPAWQALANLGLVAAILLLAIGAWRAAGSPGLPGSGDGNGTLPAGQFAMQPATPGTPESTGKAPVVIPPVATPTPTTACDFSRDIPIFQEVDESPWDGTAVLLTTTGDIVLTCPEEPAGTVLATTSKYGNVAPTWWPGTVLVPSFGEKPDEASTRVVSLVTGDVVEFGLGPESFGLGTQGTPGSPWLVGPAPNDTDDVQILDLRTMETGLLSDILGTEPPAHGGYLMGGSGDTTLALALLRHAHPAEGNATLVTEGLPGDLLVLDGSLDAATWISASEGFPPVVGFEVSPDGRYIALHGAKGSMDSREHTWSLVSLDNGAEVARASTYTTGPEPDEGVWTDAGFAYVDSGRLMLLPVNGDGAEEAVFGGDGDGPLTNLRATTDNAIVLVDQEWRDDLATNVANMQTPTMYAVDVTTGEATTITGVDVSANTRPWPYPHRFLVTFDYQLDPPDTITYRVIDALTGDTVGTIDDVPLNESGYEGYPKLGLRSVVSSDDGETEVIAFDTQRIYLMQVVDGKPVVRQIAPPEGLPESYPLTAQMFLSPDGSLLSLSAQGDEARTRWLLPLDGEPDEWLTVENQTVSDDPGYIFFVPGTGDETL